MSFMFEGVSISNDAIKLQDAYIVSNITSEEKPLKIQADKGYVSVDNVDPITHNMDIKFVCAFNDSSTPYMLAKDFLREWGIITVKIKYGGETYSHTFSGDRVRESLGDMRSVPTAKP
jgi:hypothetical protein